MFLIINNATGNILNIIEADNFTTDGGRINFSNGGSLSSLKPTVRIVEIPDQDLSHLKVDGVDQFGAWPKDIPLRYSDDETRDLSNNRIDCHTCASIDIAVHPLEGRGEQVAILRDQLTQILTALGQKPTDKFARLNKIAEAIINTAKADKLV